MRRLLVAAICAAGLVVPASAGATVDVKDVSAQPRAAGCGPIQMVAGGHRDFCVSFALDNGGTAKTLQLDLPPGVIGDPLATKAMCVVSPTETSSGGCPAASQVGEVSSGVEVLGVPATLTGEVYNLQPQPDEPARLGIQLNALSIPPLIDIPAAFVQSSVRTRLTDYGLRSTAAIPSTATLTSMTLTLWGSDQGHTTSLKRPFIDLPTRCGVPATTTVTVRGGSPADQDSASDSFTIPTADCAKVPFSPSLLVGPNVDPDTGRPFYDADTPGAASATLVVPGTDTVVDGEPRRQSYVRDVELRLPEGVGLNPPLGNGLVPCTEEEFGQFVDAKPQCPESSKIGTVEFVTPLFAQPLKGDVYFGVPGPGERLRNFVSVEDPRLRVKLIGGVKVDETTGAITNVFKDSPQVPFTEFKFEYNGGDRAVLTSPFTCGVRRVTAPMTPWNGAPTQEPFQDFDTINCPPPMFTPTLGVSVDDTQAGADTAMTVHIERQDRQIRLRDVTVKLPPGLAGRLGAVPACALDSARAATCPADSKVGSATVAVGTGAAPLSLPGEVFLTQGFDGAIAGLAITVPAKVPALDLGTVVSIAKLVVNADASIDVITQNLPQSVHGIPVAYRTIDLRIDRPGFMLNGTNCSPQAVRGIFTGIDGTTATSDAPYAATGCAALPFQPALDATVGAPGQTAKGKHPPLTVIVRQAAGQAAMKRAVVTLPLGINIDLINLKVACSDAQLGAGACPAASRIGSVRADTPLLPTPLTGGAYLTQPKPGKLPGLALDLGLVRLRGDVSFTPQGRLTTTFDGIPDVPLSRLVLQLAGGPKAALKTASDLCATTSAVDSTFVSQGDVSRSLSSPATVLGCPSLKGSATLSGVKRRGPALTLAVASLSPLRELRIGLPRPLRPAGAMALRTRARVVVQGERLRTATVRWRKGRLVVGGLAGARRVRLTLARGALRQRGAIRPGRRLRFSLVAVDTRGGAKSVRIATKAKR